MDNTSAIEQGLADAVMGRPYGFSVGGKHFFLYPITMGKMFLLQRQVDALGVKAENIQVDVSIEALRLAKEKQDECLTIIAYHTCKTPEEIFDNALIVEKKNLFRNEMSQEDIAALMILVLTMDKTSTFMTHLKIDQEHDKMARAMKIKESKNSLVFGGKSVYGTLIDAACERYGWTKEYVVWGIDYTSLRLMLADKVNSVYFTDDELKKLPASVRNNNEDIIRPTKENMERILSMNWK